MMPLLVVVLQVKDQAFLGLLQRQLQQRSAAVPAAYSAADADLAEQQAAQLASSAFSRVRECTQTRRSSPPPLATAVSRSTCQCHAVGVDTAVPQNRAVLPVGAVGLNGRHTGPRDRFAQGNRRGGKIPSLPCVSTALVLFLFSRVFRKSSNLFKHEMSLKIDISDTYGNPRGRKLSPVL